MDNFITVSIHKPPYIENIIDACKIKTFAWCQYLVKEKIIPETDIEFYNNYEIYISYRKAIENITLASFEMKEDKITNYRLKLTYKNKYFFMYKIVIDDDSLMKKNEKEENDYISNDPNTFNYPETLFFYEKMKEETFNRFLLRRFYCNIKVLFNDTIKLVKIVLIDKNLFKIMFQRSSSDYTSQRLNNNMLKYDDITFFFFYHSTLSSVENIYGFNYYKSDLTSILSIDTRIKRPKKKNNTLT